MAYCRICDTELPEQAVGRPRRYCSAGCKRVAALWREVEAAIERARGEGDVEFAEERSARLAAARADARNGWAGARARTAEINRRIREWNG